MPVSADLGKPLEDYVGELVKTGRYRSRSEVLREGVRLVQEREAKLAELRRKIDEGIAAADRGDSRPAEEVFAELRAEILAMKEKARNAG
ncbi:type II toxin-antitoxin system ParD family antitoxin [Chelativorans xinjiangense]|uniref:type II toxin-antitoxin system ParD family antitoxin n=1 Tax=Chelativorans xinjiangense TaxID=2681485 RepID=UPI00135A1B97|nr:type II toxin-antitoxin system ParD family antitoxin [Chelativorans xinjiangense]